MTVRRGWDSFAAKMKARLLVFNCHEAWVHQLAGMDYELDVIVGLPGRYTTGWDERMRPAPGNARLVRLEEALESREAYHCIVAHNMTDLLDVKARRDPKLLILHCTLDGLIHEENSPLPPDEIRRTYGKYLELTRTHVVAVSELKGKTWGFAKDVILLSANPQEYLPYSGELARGLRISNQISRKRGVLRWDFHEAAFAGVPVQLVGHNPDLPGVEAAQDWNHLRQMLSAHRFYIHTADARYEDWYNMSTLEAMAAGLPVLGNRHPSSPIEHGVSGFLSDDAAELRDFSRRLLADRELAARMGAAARKTVEERFSPRGFREAMENAVEKARRR